MTTNLKGGQFTVIAATVLGGMPRARRNVGQTDIAGSAWAFAPRRADKA